jgi:CRISPR system Cascade subunit CasA
MATSTMPRPEGRHNPPALSPAPYNLLCEPWLPVRRRDGQRELIAPAQITDDLQNNPVVSIDWPRPDFRAATLELLIGLLATACPPADEDEWLERWRTPPAPSALAAAFAPLAVAFNLDGDGPCFAQDFDAALPGAPNEPETLLIEAPGEKTERDNKTLFVKAGRGSQLSRAAAAIALYTLQTYAPAGGSGILTSLRGGGPLTTLVLPGGKPALWHVLWANVPQGKWPAARDLPRVFPWLAETRTANRFPATAPADAHPLQAFWGMPRRIRLSFADNASELPCALTGVVDTTLVTGWRQRPSGVKYTSWDHPLSPYYKNAAAGGGWLPLHPQPGGIGYQHWAGLVVGDAAGSRRPAPVITAWQSRQLDLPADARDARICASGFDTDNMKARGFVESEMPLPGSGDQTAQQSVAFLAQHLISAAEETARAVRYAVRDARYPRGTATDSAPLAAVYEAFWQATHSGFFRVLREASPQASAPVERALEHAAPAWLRQLSDAALALFDEAAPLDPGAESFDPARVVQARRQLWFTLNGYGAGGTKLFTALLLPTPQLKRSPREPRPTRTAPHRGELNQPNQKRGTS